jgi:hypothetical protein
MSDDALVLRPIGVIHSPFALFAGTPIQKAGWFDHWAIDQRLADDRFGAALPRGPRGGIERGWEGRGRQ